MVVTKQDMSQKGHSNIFGIPTGKKHRTTINLNRKHSTVLEKIHQLFEIMWNLGYHKTIPHRDLVYLISKHCGADRGTIRAYIGHTTYAGKSQ